MPYSKDPARYPKGLFAIIEAFRKPRPNLELPQETASAAVAVRLQLQSFFSAVEAQATAADKMLERLERQPHTPALAQAAAEAARWRELAKVVRELMVRQPKGTTMVIVQPRGGNALEAQVLAALSGTGEALPQVGFDQLIDQLKRWRVTGQAPEWAASGDVLFELETRFGVEGRAALERADQLVLADKAFAALNLQKGD